MAQDSDVARMAAALRTPSLRYRSFGNEPVRNPPAREATETHDAFPLLGEALAAIESLPPEASIAPMPEPMKIAEEAPRPAPALPAAPPPVTAPMLPVEAVAAVPPVRPHAHSHATPVQQVPVRPAPPPLPATSPVGAAPPVPSAAPLAPRAASRPVLPSGPHPVQPATVPGGTPSLLQTLLAEAPARPALPAAAPIVVGRHPPQAPLPPSLAVRAAAAERAEPILPTAPPTVVSRGLATPPVPPPPNPRDAMGWTGGRAPGPGSGSSLLDTLVGRGDPSQSAAHYPLLDALTAAMRSDLSGASSRVWPAARVEMALPELLRRVAAGVRSGRGLV